MACRQRFSFAVLPKDFPWDFDWSLVDQKNFALLMIGVACSMSAVARRRPIFAPQQNVAMCQGTQGNIRIDSAMWPAQRATTSDRLACAALV